MTNEELNLKISNASDVAWFQDVEALFKFDNIDLRLSKKGLSSIFRYVKEQESGWKNLETILPRITADSLGYFSKIASQITQLVNDSINDNSLILNNRWSNISSTISNTGNLVLPFDAPETAFLFTIYQKNATYFDGAYNYLLSTNSYNNSKNFLFGGILAYEFMRQGHSDISLRSKIEEGSIDQIKADFQQYVSSTENQLVTNLNNSKQKVDNFSSQVDNLLTEKTLAFNEWFGKVKKDEWQNWYDAKIKTISDLELTYKEKLKLDEPAKYWAERAVILKGQGWTAMWVAIGLIILIAIFLGTLLWSTPDTIYLSWFGNDKSAAIRWTIIFITLISFLGFGIRAITKIMFSSFHLARDCEERNSLTYFYLSLLQDSKVDEKDRELIMQSLFSRAETGLLKDDSSPTMPNDILSKLISK